MSRPPPNASDTSAKTRATSSSERTSQAVTSGLSTCAARSRTFCSIRSPWYVKASFAPPSASLLAIAHASERLFATPRTRPVFPSNFMGGLYDFGYIGASLRRLLLFVALAALTAVPAASAAFRPIHRDFGELTIPQVRAGHVTIPAAHTSGRVRAIVSLKLAPLAQAYGRGLYAAGSAQRLKVGSAASRAYLRRLEAEQSAA